MSTADAYLRSATRRTNLDVVTDTVIERVLTNDPGMGVIRHVDAGYEHATEIAHERGVRIPMQENE